MCFTRKNEESFISKNCFIQSHPVTYIRKQWRHTHNPAATISGHVTVHLHGFATVVIDIDRIDSTLQVSIPHNLSAVHGEWVSHANYKKQIYLIKHIRKHNELIRFCIINNANQPLWLLTLNRTASCYCIFAPSRWHWCNITHLTSQLFLNN